MLRIRYTDVGGLETERVVEPQHVVVGPQRLLPHRLVPPARRATGCSGWTGSPRAERVPPSAARRGPRPSRSSTAHRTKLPASGAASRRSLLANTDTGLSRSARDGGCSPPHRRVNRTHEGDTHDHAPHPAPWPGSRSPPTTPTAPRSSTAACSTGASTPTARPPPAAWTTATSRPPAPSGPMGGIFGTGGQVPGHAVFYILVADVEATCADAEQLGGAVVAEVPRAGAGRPAVRLPARPVGQPVRRLHAPGGLMAPPAKRLVPVGGVRRGRGPRPLRRAHRRPALRPGHRPGHDDGPSRACGWPGGSWRPTTSRRAAWS